MSALRRTRLTPLLFGMLASSAAASACLRAADLPQHWSCGADGDCPSEQHCVAKLCQAANYCESSTDCPAPRVCKETRCSDLECTAGAEERCAPYRCNYADKCNFTCATSSDCLDPHNLCHEGQCVAAMCEPADEARDCSGFACVSGSCVSTCGAYPCAVGFNCVAGACQRAANKPEGASCSDNAECAPLPCCTPSLGAPGTCVASCANRLQGEPCRWNAECSSQICDAGVCASCTGDDCGQLFCRDKTCGSLGGFSCGECANGEQCANGQCAVTVCDPGTPFFCSGGAVFQCIDGVEARSFATCTPDEACLPGQTACVPYACQANLGFCFDQQFYACDSQGRYSGAPAQSCVESGLVCSHLGCGRTAVEDVAPGGGALAQDQNTCGNVYLVETPVSLVSFKQTFSSGGAELRWFVLVSDTLAGPYAPVFPIDRYLTTNVNLMESLDLNVPLQAGRYYFLGVSANATAFALDAVAATPHAVSFGTLVSGLCSANGLAMPVGPLSSFGVAPQTLNTVWLPSTTSMP